jgi:hypothetical protein
VNVEQTPPWILALQRGSALEGCAGVSVGALKVGRPHSARPRVVFLPSSHQLVPGVGERRHNMDASQASEQKCDRVRLNSVTQQQALQKKVDVETGIPVVNPQPISDFQYGDKTEMGKAQEMRSKK